MNSIPPASASREISSYPGVTMNSLRRCGFLTVMASVILISTSPAAVIFQDTFTNLSNWTAGATGTGAIAPLASGGSAVMDAGSTAGSLSVMRSLSTDFNPFVQSFSASLTGLSFTGGPGAGSKPISYLMVGRMDSASSGGKSGIGNYYAGNTPTAGNSAGNVYVQILERTTNAFSVRVGEAAGIGTTGTPAEINISGAPTALDWVLGVNGSNLLTWSLTLTGAAFTTEKTPGTLPYSGLGTATLSGLFSSSISSSALTNSYLSLGVQNNGGSGNIGTSQTFSVDAVSVVTIPEPSSIALVASALLLVGLHRRRATR